MLEQSEPLRVAVFVDSGPQPRWRCEVLRAIQQSEFARVALIVRKAGRPETESPGRLQRIWADRGHFLYNAYGKLDERLFRTSNDAFEPMDLSELQLDCPVLEVRALEKRYSDRLEDADVDRILAEKIDVGLRFGFRILRGRVLGCARYGLWSYHHGDNRVNRGSPPAFWEVMHAEPVTGSVLQRLSEELDGGEVLYRSSGATDRRSVARSRQGLYWKSLHFVIRKLAELHREGELSVEADSLVPYCRPLFRRPGNREMLGLVAGLTGRYVRDKLTDRRDRWKLYYHVGKRVERTPAPLYRFKPLVPPRDRFWADPFPVAVDGRYYVFFEEFLDARNRAHISVLPIDERGNAGPATPVLERDYHLSYPFVFEWEGRLHMIPESGANRSVDLYECVEFPGRWELKRTLLSGVKAVDATLHRQGDRWWMFVNIAQQGASTYDELHLFCADSPVGPWEPHRANPVKSDCRSSRPAGSLFTRDGRLYRPAQDCSTRYGAAVVLNEVHTLTPDAYHETESARIDPDWSPHLRGTHTYNRCNSLTILDAV